MDLGNLTSDVLILGGEESVKQITKTFNQMLEMINIPAEWKESKMTIPHKKGDIKDSENYRHISLLSHMYKLLTRILQKRMERVLNENQPRHQAGFRKCYTTVDHLQTISQLIDKCYEFNRPPCIEHIYYEKTFYSKEHEAIFKALGTIGINKTFVTIPEDINTGTAVHTHG